MVKQVIFQLLAPITDNPNAHIPNDIQNIAPIWFATYMGNSETVKILALWTKILKCGISPFYAYSIVVAARKGHIEIVKLLAPLLDYPNSARFIQEAQEGALEQGHQD